MGKINFTPIQEQVVDFLLQNKSLTSKFYFTGGTALSSMYFNHRYSEDLDFFSEDDFEDQEIIQFMNLLSEKLRLNLVYTKREKARIFGLKKDDDQVGKVDFVYFPYKRLEKGKKYKDFSIDSLRDIATNKLLTINQRDEIKDFVDLYFLLKEFTVWDLLYAMPVKFEFEYDVVLLAADLLKVGGFDVMPRMIKPLTLTELKTFFRAQAKELGSRIVKP